MFIINIVRLIYLITTVICNFIIFHLLNNYSNTHILIINILLFLVSIILVKKFKLFKVEYNITLYYNIIISLGVFLFFRYPPKERFSIYIFIIFYLICLIIYEKKKYLKKK